MMSIRALMIEIDNFKRDMYTVNNKMYDPFWLCPFVYSQQVSMFTFVATLFLSLN